MGRPVSTIFTIADELEFEGQALKTFEFQYRNNDVYRTFCDHLKKNPFTVGSLKDIPFMPIGFFKNKRIISSTQEPTLTFTSSGTTAATTSKHHLVDIELYRKSFTYGFDSFYGDPKDYCLLALLPSYLERQGSSLIYMVDKLMQRSNHPQNGYFLYDLKKLKNTLQQLEAQNQKTLLIGVSYALLDFVTEYSLKLKNTIVMETGGMKGRKKEIVRDELHQILAKGFGVDNIHSEYGMTELLSQAYSKGNGRFYCPPWMRVFSRDTEDPLSHQNPGKTGGLNIIDLANQYSCAFIATQDLGRVHNDGSFEVLGRFDHADVRGCNLMAL